MLCDPRFAPITDGQRRHWAELEASLHSGIKLEDMWPKKVRQGVYTTIGHNPHLYLDFRPAHELQWPHWPDHEPWLSPYGVCDNPEQMLAHYDGVLNSCIRRYCVFFTRLDRQDEPPEGGWRWHKWGPYIGTQNPRHEYLYDDTHIDTVWCYHVYELTEDQCV